ncbi:hypothetical protein AMTRI_Chr02g262370 [Amborella trichopoda]
MDTEPSSSNSKANTSKDEGGKSLEKEEISESMGKLLIEETQNSGAGNLSSNFKRKPVVIIVVGMAGSGKTTLLHRLVHHTKTSNIRGYVLNLDPAVLSLPFGANIDIRDSVKYKEVMKEYNLGPNGGILTSLNLFSTMFGEVITTIERRANELDYVLVDTPGQIEIFTWSASGQIITEAFASTFPTVVAYVVDTPRSASPVTFMSNMLYACSILYKTRLPMVLAFNKVDVAQHQFALEVGHCYCYLADLDKRRAEKDRLEEERRRENMEKLRKDMEKTRGETVVLSTGLKNGVGSKGAMDVDEEKEDEEEEDEDFERFSMEEEEDEDNGDDSDDEEVAKFSF